jgi:hypothetical protein
LLEQLEGLLGRAVQLSIDDLDGRLRGQRLLEVAVQLLDQQPGRREPIHYKDWFQILVDNGYRVGGKDPVATFLAQINRSDRVESLGNRSGRYRLRVA